MALHHHGSPVITCLRLISDIVDVQFDPGRRQHVVNELVFAVAPVTRKFLQLESDDFLVGVQHGIHIGVQALQRVHGVLVELYLDLVVGIRTNDEVHIIPV